MQAFNSILPATSIVAQATASAQAPIPQQAERLEREALAQFCAAHRGEAAKKALSPEMIVAFNIARGLPASRGFTPITNAKKLANGTSAMGAFDSALRVAKMGHNRALGHFAHALTAAECAQDRLGRWSGPHPLLALLAKA